MTRDAFIKKWLGNKDYSYTEENRDLMRDDLDKVIDFHINPNRITTDKESIYTGIIPGEIITPLRQTHVCPTCKSSNVREGLRFHKCLSCGQVFV